MLVLATHYTKQPATSTNIKNNHIIYIIFTVKNPIRSNAFGVFFINLKQFYLLYVLQLPYNIVVATYACGGDLLIVVATYAFTNFMKKEKIYSYVTIYELSRRAM